MDSICWFCEEHFNANRTSRYDKKANFKARMHHIRDHFLENYCTTVDRMIDEIRPDFFMLTHLNEHRLIREAVFERAKSYQDAPTVFFPRGWEPQRTARVTDVPYSCPGT